MKTETTSRLSSITLGVLVILMSLSLFIAGCAENQVQTTPTPQAQPESAPEPAPEPAAQEQAEEVEVQREEPTTPDETKTAEKVDMVIADGTYTEELSYSSPAGQETTEVTMSVKDDVVTAVTLAVDEEAHDVSQKMMGAVHDGLQDLMVGKSLDEIEIPERISGSSLTTAAFASLLDEMKEKY